MKAIFGLLFMIFSMSCGLLAQTTFWRHTGGPGGAGVASILENARGEFLAATRGGVYRSADKGANWHRTNWMKWGVGWGGAGAMVMNGSGEIFAASDYSGIRRSTDHGENWTELKASAILPAINALVVTPNQNIFAATDSALYRSTDGGTSWGRVGPRSMPVYTLIIAANGDLLAGTDSGVRRSTNDGVEWAPAGLNRKVILLGRSGESVYASTENGAYLSRNGDNQWEMMNGLHAFQAFAADSAGNLYFAVGEDMFRGVRGRSGLTHLITGLRNGKSGIVIGALAADGQSTLIAGSASIYRNGNEEGLFRSTDRGDRWILSKRGLANVDIFTLVTSSRGSMYAAASGISLQRSADNGATWERVLDGLCFKVAAAPDGTIYAQADGRMWRSTDDGFMFQEIPLFNVWGGSAPIEFVATDDTGTVFVGTAGEGIHRSTDMGATWTPPTGAIATEWVRSFISAPNGHLFAGTQNGVYRSTDGGANWDALPATAGEYVPTIGRNREGHILAAFQARGIHISTDDGNTWTATSATGDEGYSDVRTMTLDERSGEIFAGVDGLGVGRSTDGGRTWKEYNDGLTDYAVWGLAVTADGYIAAGTMGSGVFRSAAPISSGVAADSSAGPGVGITAIYPNPVRDRAQLSFRLPRSGHVTLRLYTMLGDETARVIDAPMAAGEHTVALDGGMTDPGPYLCRLVCDGEESSCLVFRVR